MSRLFAVLLSFFVFTAQADSGFHGSLKVAFDELNYSLTVEWDQQDKTFYQQKMNEFNHTMLSLKSQGMTNQDLLNFMIESMPDKAVAQDLKNLYEMAQTQKLSPAEVELLVKDLMQRHYARGADWIGTVLLIGAGLIVLIVGVTALMLWDASNNPDNCKYDYVCDANNNCSFTNYHCD